MKRIVVLILFTLITFFGSFKSVEASLLTLKPGGNLQLNVLSAESDILLTRPEHTDIQIDTGVGGTPSPSIVKLNNVDGKANLKIFDDEGVKSLNVTDYKENVIEIEERPEVQRLEIRVIGEKFGIKNKGTLAITSFPITVDSENAQVAVVTDSGEKSLDVYPSDAVQTTLRTKFLSRVNSDGVELVSEEDTLQYKISGEKLINFFDIYTYSIPISSYISAGSGEVLKIDAPGWLKFINFFLA